MVALLERDAELADAGISYRCRNLEYTLGRSREEFRGPGHTLLQEILVKRDPIHLTEAGFQRRAGDPEPLGQHLNGQPFIQVPHHVFLDLAYGVNLALGMVIALRRQGQSLPLRVEQEQDFQRLDNIVVPDMSQLHIVQGRKQSFASECRSQHTGIIPGAGDGLSQVGVHGTQGRPCGFRFHPNKGAVEWL